MNTKCILIRLLVIHIRLGIRFLAARAEERPQSDSPQYYCSLPAEGPVRKYFLNNKNDMLIDRSLNLKYWNVVVHCETGFLTRNETAVFESFCQPDNKWKPPLDSCDLPDCGLADEVILSQGWLLARFTEAPWHVAIYNTSSNYNLFCGGTLISPKIILSAAHCFYDKFNYQIQNQTSHYAVIVAKKSRNFNKTDNIAQKSFQVKEILVPEKCYNPHFSGHDGSDIILLVLKEPVRFNQYTYPACVEWNENWGFKHRGNVSGRIAGWGIDETGRLSQVLKIGELPYVSYTECAKYLKYVTHDKFCAGSGNAADGPGVRKGDGGGGLVFMNPTNNLYYLRGIASVRELYHNVSTSSFTDVSYYINWIQDVKKNIDDDY